MLGYLRTKLGIQRIFGIPFISLRPFGLFVQQILRASPLTYYNLIGYQCVDPIVPMGRPSVLFFFMLFSFSFGGRIPHPPFVLLFLSIYSRVVSYQEKNVV